ncbi:MAG: hypothetical protein CMC45_01490 [Flavobacteriaceae bacterium]|nr:hypothetical protein [Flavobacteriaceae bacterium]
MKKLFYIISIFTFYLSFSQNYFYRPIEYDILLSGNFGEIRSSGFHTGIDIKTKGKVGEIIRSIDDGYISRIQVSTVGYGKVIYINHSNGLKSVYGHLQDFSKEIDEQIKYFQYRAETFTINKFFKENEIRIKAGQIIGYSGNTGTSFGPHLHFEIRTYNDVPLNPLNYNYKVEDSIRPEARKLFAYKEKKGSLFKKRLKMKKINDSIYETQLKSVDTIFFGIETTDKQSFTYNVNGTYKILLKENSSDLIEFKFDSLTFDEKRLFLKHLDFKELVENNSKIILLNNEINSNYKFVRKNQSGRFYVKNSDIKDITIMLSDLNKNNTYVKIKMIGDSIEKFGGSKRVEFNKIIRADLSYDLTYNNANVKFKKNTFYRDTTIDFDFKNDTLYIINPYVPVNKSFIINFPIDIDLKKGLYLARLDKNGNKFFSSSQLKNNFLISNTKALGKYYINVDTIKPTIKKIGKNKIINKNQNLGYLINDDETGIKKYKAYINDKWALFEYEPKKNYIQFRPDNFINLKNENNLLIEIEDMVGNVTKYQETFYFKN